MGHNVRNLFSAITKANLALIVILMTMVQACAGPNIRDRYFEALETEKGIGAYEIDVANRSGGSLTLSGKVSSLESSNRAEAVARNLDGVSSVENNLVVDPALKSSSSEEQKKNIAKVMAALKERSDLGKYHVAIQTQGNVVILSGDVQSQRASESIERLVKDSVPYASLSNRLVINAPSNEELTERVRRALDIDTEVSSQGISIKSENGVVTIAGNEPNHRIRDRILSIALNVDGVKDVRSELH